MNLVKDFAYWKSLAETNIVAIGSIVMEIRTHRLDLDRDQPNLFAMYRSHPNDPLQHDCRREFLSAMISALQHAALSYSSILHLLTDERWWQRCALNYSKEEAEQQVSDFAINAKDGVFYMIAIQAEETMRLIVRSAPDVFTVDSTAELKGVYAHLLKVVGKQQYEPLFDILRLTRNTIHNNGYHLSKRQIDETIQYDGRTFAFRHAKPITHADEEFILKWLIKKLCEAHKDIVRTGVIRAIPACRRC
jgi:hypothetical protein